MWRAVGRKGFGLLGALRRRKGVHTGSAPQPRIAHGFWIASLTTALAGAGCDELPSASPNALGLAKTASAEPDPLVYRSRALSFRIRSALMRLNEPMPAVTRFGKQACPDPEIALRATGAAARQLVLTTQDSRYEAHSLLPLRLTRELQTDPEGRLHEFFEPDGQQPFSSTLDKLLKSPEHGQAAEQTLSDLEQQAYKGVFHITQYKKPHLIRKKGKRRREWTRGLLRAWLVVYDIDSSEALCQVEIITFSDVSDEPLSIRLRAETQQRLVRELGQQLRSEAALALASVSHTLTLPPAESPEASASQRIVRLDQPPGRQ